MEKQTYEGLKQKLRGELLEQQSELLEYAHDASIFSITPGAVIWPKDTHDIQAAVAYVNENKATHPGLSMTARAAGTDMTGGSINDSIIIDVSRHMNRLEKIGDDYAIVEPGMYYRDFETAAIARGLQMPAYPASKMICALGGMVGNNSGGEKSLSYGQCKDYVQGLWAVLADGKEYYFEPLNEAGLKAKLALKNYEGELYRAVYKLISENYDAIKLAKPSTSKNSSGYFLWDVWDKNTGIFDMTKLLVGSQGTLGIVTKINFKLIRPKRCSGLLALYLPDLSQVGNIVNTVKNFGPESFEIYDKSTLDLAMNYLPEIFHKMKGRRLRLAFDLIPEVIMKLTGRLPQTVMFAEFTGDSDEEVKQKLEAANAEIHANFNIKTKLARSYEEMQKYWTIRRESYNLLRMHNAGKLAACFIEDIIVHPQELGEFLPRLYAIFKKHPSFIYTVAGHAGDANFHIMPLMDFKDAANRKVILEMSGEVFDLVKEFNGSMSAEHNDGIVRGLFLSKMFNPEIFALFQETKKIFDPQSIFNPNKKTQATAEYFMSHLKEG